MRMLSDPWLFIWHIHLLLTFIHFITWQVGLGCWAGLGWAGHVRVCAYRFEPLTPN
jgi:hypothetical protein